MNITAESINRDNERDLKTALSRGVRSKCPCCGKGSIFAKQLTVVDNCSHCNVDLSHQRADDLPAYLNIFVVGHVVIGTMMALMAYIDLGMWPLTFLTVTIAVIAAFCLMRPLKGLVVAAQWALGMHGFSESDE